MINDTYVARQPPLPGGFAPRAVGYTELYYEAFEQRARGILRDRLSRAAGDVGSYWYTAWTAAGRPDLK